jgi:hypothetical protein
MAGAAVANPFAAYGGNPVPPPATGGGGDPFAAYGGSAVPSGASTAVPPPAPANPDADLAANPKGEGTYQLVSTKDGKSALSVPYSQVPKAMERGYGLPFGSPDADRYTKDRSADPETSKIGDLMHVLVTAPAAHALEMAKGAVKHEAEVPQSVAAWFGGDEAKQGMKNLENRILPGSGNAATNADQEKGGNLANIAEFAAGEKVLAKLTEAIVPLAEGADYAEKLKNASPVIKMAAAHPRIARVLLAGLGQGALGGGQAAAHGADAGETARTAVEQGAIGAGLTAPFEGFANAAEAAAARTAAEAAHEGAPAVQAARTEAMQAGRQATAQGQVKGVVQKSADGAFQRFNEATKDIPGVEPITAVDTSKMGTFADAGDALKEKARTLYQALDTSSAFKGKLEEAQNAFDAATSGENVDYKAADAAEKQMDDLLASKPKDVDPATLQAANTAWRDYTGFAKLHNVTEGAYNGISEEMAAKPGMAARQLKPGTANGGTLQTRLGTYLRDPRNVVDAARLVGDEGLENLYRSSNLVSHPELAKATQAIADEVAKQFPAPAKPHPVAQAIRDTVTGGAAGALLAQATGMPHIASEAVGGAAVNGSRYLLQKMVMSPRIGKLVDFAVRNNVPARQAAGLIVAAMRNEDGTQEQK